MLRHIIILTLMACSILQTPAFDDKTSSDYVLVDISESGFEIWGRSLEPHEAHRIDPSKAGSWHGYTIDPYLSISILGDEIYVDEDQYYDSDPTHKTLFVVNPKTYHGPVLALKPDSFVELLDGPYVLLVTMASRSYFTRHHSKEPAYGLRNELIDPHECENSNPPSGAVHHVNAQDPKSDCHGQKGEMGSCDGSTDHGSYEIHCSIIEGVDGSAREVCRAIIKCENGDVDPNGQEPPPGVETPLLYEAECSTRLGGNSARAGMTSDGKAFVECGGTRKELHCK